MLSLQRMGQLTIAVLIGITLGNQIKAARFRRAVDLGYRDGFHTGQLTRRTIARLL